RGPQRRFDPERTRKLLLFRDPIGSTEDCYGPESGHNSFLVGPMRRREFMGLIGGTAAAWPLGARGQQKTRNHPTIMFVGAASTIDQETRRVFESACSEFGWFEG